MAYKVFTNGSPLPASDLNTYLMNQSVMVFANSTARSAALTSPTEGMTTYLEDTNKVEVWTGAAWTDINDNSAMIPKSTVTATGDLIVGNGNASVTRLGIGTNGQVLQSNGTTATWVTPSGGGGLTQLKTGSLSGTVVNITSIPTTYKALALYFENATLTSGNESLYLRFNGDTGTNYSWTRINTTGTSVSSNSNISFIPFFQIYSSNPLAGWADIRNYSSNSGDVIVSAYAAGTTGTAELASFAVGSYSKPGSPANEINLSANGATFNSGSYILYGVN